MRLLVMVSAYLTHLVVAGCVLGFSGCRSPEMQVTETTRESAWEEMTDVIVSSGMVGHLEEMLFSDEWPAFIEEDFPGYDDCQRERVVYSLRERAVLEAARYHAFDDVLLRYYYGDAQYARELSAEKQIEQAVLKLEAIGPKNTDDIEKTPLPDGSKATMEYKLSNLSIKANKAEVESDVSYHGRSRIFLERRLYEDGVRVWIPTSRETFIIY